MNELIIKVRGKEFIIDDIELFEDRSVGIGEHIDYFRMRDKETLKEVEDFDMFSDEELNDIEEQIWKQFMETDF